MHTGAEDVQGYKYVKLIVTLVPTTDYEEDRQRKEIFIFSLEMADLQGTRRRTEARSDCDCGW